MQQTCASRTERNKNKEHMRREAGGKEKKNLIEAFLRSGGGGWGCTVGRERIKAHNCIIIAVDT